MPPAELAPAEWTAGAPRLQPYQETVSYLLNPNPKPKPNPTLTLP